MKKISIVMMSLLIGLLNVGCGSTQNNQEEIGKKLHVGLISSISALPLLVAEEQGYFDELGLDVSIDYFKSAQDRDAALQAGELDGVLCDQIAISTYQNAGIDMQITGKTDGGFVLVGGADSGITSVSDLVGKKIAISENTVIEYTLDKLLETAGLTDSQVEKVAIPSMPTRLEMLMSGEIDAALLPPPYSDTAIGSGGNAIEVVESDSEFYISVTAFNQKVIDENREAIEAYYQAYDKAVDYINNSEVSTYEDIIIETIGYPETMRGHIVAPVFHHNSLPSVATVEDALSWCREKGLLEVELTPEDILTTVETKK